MESEKSSSKIVITVSDPQAKKQYGGAIQYYLYSIKGEDSKGPINIHRRYSDFDQIRNLLIKRWPGCFLPSLPSKLKLAPTDEDFLDIRSKYLERFLVDLSKKQFLWYSDEFQIFLKNDLMDFQKVLASFWKIEPQDIVYRYETIFNELKTDDEAKVEENISAFSKYLGTLLNKLQELRNKSEELHNTQAKYQRKYSKFLLNALSSYEDKCLSFYSEEKDKDSIAIFSASENAQKKQTLQETLKQAPLKILFQELKRQKRQIISFQQTLKEREDFLKQKTRIQGKIKQHEIKITELKTGKQSFLAKIRSLTTETEITSHQKSIQKYKAQLQVCNNICKYIKLIVGTVEIKTFKEERIASYYKMVQDIARQQIKMIQVERQFWMAISANNHLNFEIQNEEKGISLQQRLKQIQEENDAVIIQPIPKKIEVLKMKNQLQDFTNSNKKIDNQQIKETQIQNKVQIKENNIKIVQNKEPKQSVDKQINPVQTLTAQQQKDKKQLQTVQIQNIQIVKQVQQQFQDFAQQNNQSDSSDKQNNIQTNIKQEPANQIIPQTSESH